MSTQAPTIAFFGATGGVANATLVHALRAGMNVVVLVRTPSKLTAQLEAQGLDPAVLNAQLTIIAGDALDKAVVKQTITANRRSYLVPYIMTGLGAAPKLTFNWSNPCQLFTLDQPSLCGDAAKTLLAALSDVYHENANLTQQPHLTFVSTTGISRGAEDVPFGLRTLYHSLLAVPHIDKREMEATFRDNVERMEGTPPLLASVTGVRPTLLTGSASVTDAAGLDKVKAGTEDKPATGFSIKRSDVGHWIWENLLADSEVRKRWEGEMVSLTS